MLGNIWSGEVVMHCDWLHKLLLGICMGAALMLWNPRDVHGQARVQMAAISPPPSEPADEIRVLSNLIHDLQIHVQELNSELASVRIGPFVSRATRAGDG